MTFLHKVQSDYLKKGSKLGQYCPYLDVQLAPNDFPCKEINDENQPIFMWGILMVDEVVNTGDAMI